MNYEQAKQEFESIYGVNPTAWDTCYSTPGKPLSAYTIFKTYEGANTFIHGKYDDEDEIYTYDAYVGAVIAVVKDTSGNNGLYQVVFDSSMNPSTYENKYKLVKMLSEEDASIGGQITVLLKNETGVAGRNGEPSVGWSTPGSEEPSNDGKTTPYIYFVGVDSSTREQHPDTLYFNDGIVYDASGSNLFQNSDERLKNIVANIEPDLDELRTIDKVVFNWKQDKSRKNNIGVIAQTVEKLYPELVINNPDSGYKMVNYAGLSVIALAAVDKLYEKVKDLEAEVTRLKNVK